MFFGVLKVSVPVVWMQSQNNDFVRWFYCVSCVVKETHRKKNFLVFEQNILHHQSESDRETTVASENPENLKICGLFTRSGSSRNEGKTAVRLIEILRMYFDTSLKTSRRDCSAISSFRPLSQTGNFFFPLQNWFLREREKMSDGSREDTTMIVQIEEVKWLSGR
jgi:hypothetical protein